MPKDRVTATCKTCRWQPIQLSISERERTFIRLCEELNEAKQAREAVVNKVIARSIHHEPKETGK